MKKIKDNLVKSITEAVKTLPGDIQQEKLQKGIEISPCAKQEFGDYSTNIAFKISDKNLSPSTAAKNIVKYISENPPSFLEKVEEKNGFINFFVKKERYIEQLQEILKKKNDFGSAGTGKNKKILIEFVSANPTGPLTIAHGRQAAFGESLARILKFAGFDVTKEYYLNDGGRQIELLGKSLQERYNQLHGKNWAIPEEGYQGEYIVDIAKKIKEEPDSFDFFPNFAMEEILKIIQEDLINFGVKFDNWFKESSLIKNKKVQEAIHYLKEKGLIYQQEDAWWFKSSSFGDEKDRVIIKKDGSYTYLASDLAYHKNKIERGYTILINILGPDHHGYIPRLKAAVESFGFPQEKLKNIIVQLTTLYRGKEKLQMSTRKGQFISLKELMEEVGPDASKFFFLFRRADSHLDFDIELTKKKSFENPVYYLQYAYVRMLHVLHFAKEQGIEGKNLEQADFSLLTEEEIKFVKKLSFFPDVIEKVGKNLEVHLLAEFLLELTRNFHSYYQNFRIVGEEKNLSTARLALTKSLFYVFSRALFLLNISLPEKM